MRHLKHRGLWLALLLASTVSPNPLPLVAQTPATRKPIKIDATKLEGVPNFRDIGGYKTRDGHTIRYNMLYRSAQLTAMTLADNQMLAPLNIRYEIDLRNSTERSNAPTHWGPNPPEVIDIPFMQPGTPRPPKTPEDPLAFRRFNYTNGWAILNASTIGDILHILAQGDEPALLHCSAGQDRTGVTVAVLMTLLGASRQDVYREYLLTNTGTTEAQRQHVAAAMNQPPPPPLTPEERQKAGGAKVPLLDAFFHAIDTHYGSFDAYVRDGLKLSKEDVQNLRKRFLD